MASEITAEEVATLRAFAEKNGRRWKEALRDAWWSGRYEDAGVYEWDERAILQTLRNERGPKWLNRFSLKAAA